MLTGSVALEKREQNGDYLGLGIAVINDTDDLYRVDSDQFYINGWQVGTYADGGTVHAHTKSRNNTFKFHSLEELAGIGSLSDIECATLTIRLMKLDSNYQRLESHIIGPFTLVYTEEGFLVVPNE